MSIRPFRDIKRRKTKMIKVGSVEVGGKSPFGPNIWPDEVPELKEDSLKMYSHLEKLSDILLECCAEYIGAKSDFFTSMAKDSDTILRIIHYPPIGSEVPAGSIRSGAHEDINLITLLCSSTARGLELLQRNGEWLSVSSTGFTLKTSDTGVNASSSYIYYAHA